MNMGMEIPQSAIISVLRHQAEWEKKRELTARQEYIHKRYLMHSMLIVLFTRSHGKQYT